MKTQIRHIYVNLDNKIQVACDNIKILIDCTIDKK